MALSMSCFSLRIVLIFALFACFAHYGRCHETIGEKFLFSDKTAYHFLNKTISKPEKYDPVYVNMVIRHGSRYPSKNRVEAMSRILKELNAFFPVNQTDNTTFRYKGLSLPWSIPADVRNAASKELSSLGAQEMYWIAKRIRAKFPELFKHGYSNTNYSFIGSDKLRSSQSAVAFAQGIFEQQGPVGLSKYQPIAVKVSGPAGADRILRVHDACPKWKKTYANSQNEYAKFLHGARVQNVTEKIRSRLNNKTNVSPAVVRAMYLMCAFSTQTDSNDVSLCSLFDDEDLKVLEYLNDLKMYWSHSYGRKINYRMACPLYMKITESFLQYIHHGKPYGVFQFAHTGTVLPLLTLLGLYKDDLPLRANNFDKQTNRTFRPSNIVPMSANIAFVLYDRRRMETNHSRNVDMRQKRKVSTMMIQMLVNEVAVEIPPCKGKTYCSLKKFLDHYSHIKKTCNINRICGRLRGNCQNSRKKAGKRG